MLLCGEVHYFRVPRGLWGDRLLKVRRAGLNCVNIYFAWNFHEYRPGVFDFSGERDVYAFLEEAGRVGLYAMARVGPYICSEWDNGGHPDWLISRRLVPRSLDDTYWPYAERWLRAILPIIVKYSVANGGNVVGVQLENEYFWGDAPYHMKLAELARQVGVNVPLYTNVNRYVRNTIYTDTLDLYPNVWDLDSVVGSFRDYLETTKGPIKIMEYEGGWFSVIHSPLPTSRGSFPPNWTRILLAAAMAYGADLISFYMFHGGTNFGYWTGRWITTTYDYEASIREWGGLSERYYNVKLLTPLAKLLDGSTMISESYEGGRLLVVRGLRDGSRLRFYINNTDSQWVDGQVVVEPRGVAVVPSGLTVNGIVLEDTNLSLLTVTDNGDIILYGKPGAGFYVRLRNVSVESCMGAEHAKEGNLVVIKGNVPGEVAGCLVRGGKLSRLLVVSEQFASRTWFLDNYYVISNTYLVRDADYTKIIVEAEDGSNILYIPFKSSAGKYIPEVDMTRIELNTATEEPKIAILSASRGGVSIRRIMHIDDIKPLEELGIFEHGLYVYDTKLDRDSTIGFVVHDDAVVINNGKVIGGGFIYIKANAKAGSLRVIAESTGHPNDGTLPFFTGLQSPILVDYRGSIQVGEWSYGILDLSSRLKPGIATTYSHTMVINREIAEALRNIRWVGSIGELGKPTNAVIYYRTIIKLPEPSHIVIRISNIPGWGVNVVFVNGEEVYRGHGDSPYETTIYGGYRSGEVEVVVAQLRYGIREIPQKPGDVSIDLWAGALRGYELGVIEPGQATEQSSLPIRLTEPSTIRVRFRVSKPSDVNAPIGLVLKGGFNALIMLNGRLIGRYYEKGSQDTFYLPEPYLTSDDELTIVAIPNADEAQLSMDFKVYQKTRNIVVALTT